MKRKIVKIDESKCNGCGLCVPNCAEGALRIVNGKAKLVSEVYCDGLGACLGHCPQGAITIEETEAEAFDEEAVRSHLSKEEKQMDRKARHVHAHSGCPGAMAMDFRREPPSKSETLAAKIGSELRQWPVQLCLVSPLAPYFQGADVVLSADCVAYSLGNFHSAHLKGKSLAIACPKLDDGQEIYSEKLKSLIDEAKINTLTVMTMEVTCCSGLAALAQSAAQEAKRKVPVKHITVSLRGEILGEEWL
jgi:ferredoxin